MSMECVAVATGAKEARASSAIVFVSDMAAAVSFHRDGIGLPLGFQSPGWTEFATEAATLTLPASDSHDPDGFAISVGQESRGR